MGAAGKDSGCNSMRMTCIVRETGCGKNSPKKWCRSMTERLSIKLFGAKAIENDKIGVK